MKKLFVVALCTLCSVGYAQPNNGNRPAAPVEVNNGQNNPVPVTVIPRSSPTYMSFSLPFSNGYRTDETIVVPEGKTLRLEHVSWQVSGVNLDDSEFALTFLHAAIVLRIATDDPTVCLDTEITDISCSKTFVLYSFEDIPRKYGFPREAGTIAIEIPAGAELTVQLDGFGLPGTRNHVFSVSLAGTLTDS